LLSAVVNKVLNTYFRPHTNLLNTKEIICVYRKAWTTIIRLFINNLIFLFRFKFGKCVQILLTRTDYTELSDHTSIETDAFGIVSKLYSKFLYTPWVMSLISGHQNGDTLPPEMLQRLESANSNFNLFHLMNQTYLSAFDIECHMSDKFWTEVAEELWPKFNPIKMSERDFRPCQFVSTFGENFACKYYSHLWTDVSVRELGWH